MHWWTAASAVVSIAIAFAAWWWASKQQANRSSELPAGAAVLLVAGVAYYEMQMTLRASHDQLVSQQVSKGVEQLGSDKIVVRLAGVYALEGVMSASEQYHAPVLEALCGFVRETTKSPQAAGASHRHPSGAHRNRKTRQPNRSCRFKPRKCAAG